MDNETKDNIKQFKKEFKNFFKKATENLKDDDKEKEKQKEEKQEEKKQEKEEITIPRLFIGFFIILIGIIFLLENFNIINIDIGLFITSIIKLWPILIILVGISFFYKKHIGSTIAAIFFILLIIFMLAIMFPVSRNIKTYRIYTPSTENFRQNNW